MKLKTIVFLAMALSGNLARGAETWFDGIKCDSKIEAVLIGRAMPNGKVDAIEKKHKSLNLKLNWSDGMEADGDPWTLSSWMICGKEYLLLNRKNVTKDLLVSPQNLPNHKFTLGTCKSQGKLIPGTSVFFAPTQDKAGPKLFDRIWTIEDGKLNGGKLTFRETVGGNLSCTV